MVVTGKSSLLSLRTPGILERFKVCLCFHDQLAGNMKGNRQSKNYRLEAVGKALYVGIGRDD
jgi:hypothetical protein